MTTNAQVVQLFTDVLTRWNEREAEFRNWQAGTATGGPNADGRYPLTNGSNETFLVACPAKLADTVSGPAVLSQAAQVAAEVAQAASVTASTQANNSRLLAENFKNASLAARDLALLYRDQCAAAQVAVLAAQVAIDAALVVIEDNVEITEGLANETLEARDDTLVARAEAMVARDQAENFAASINPATLATKAELQSELDALIGAAPGTLDTLNEIAAALGDDPNFATTITNSVAGKAPLVHGHVISDVTGLDTALAGKQPVGSYAGSVHGHVISDVTGLQTALDGKQPTGSYAAASHVHTIANVTGLQTALDGKQAAGSYSLTGHTHVIADVTGLQTALDGKQASGSYVTTANFTWTNLSGKPTTFAPSAHSHVIADVTGLQSALDGKQAVLGFTPYNSTNPAGYITAAALSPYAPLNGPAFTGSVSIGGGAVFRSDWTTRYQSGSDFVDGTLVTTDIPATGFAGESFVIEVTGKSYDGGNPPFKVIAGGYLYADTITNYSGVSYGGNFAPYIKVFEEGGVLKFWWPRISYWNSFNVNVMSMDGQTNGTITRNRVTAITNSGEPTGTKKQQINLSKFMRADVSATNSVDLRAPIFYDSGNTAFYIDPASTSVLNTAQANTYAVNTGIPGYFGGIAASYGGNSSYPTLYGASIDRWVMHINPHISYTQNGVNGFGGTMTGSTIRFASDAAGSAFWDLGVNGGSANLGADVYGLSRAGTWNAYWDTAGNTFSRASSRAPIFYDLNNTGYYVDPQSGSRLGGQVAFDGGSYVASNGDIYARRDSGTTGVYYLADGGSKYLYWDGGQYIFGSAGPVAASNDFRAPIFYDSNNTAYFTDPNGRSRMASMDYGDGGYYFAGGDWGYRHNTPYGWIQFGPANSGHAHIYTDRSNFYFNAQLTVNGGSVINTGDIRSSIFYDIDNTGYYLDLNNGSRTGLINSDNLRTQNNVYLDQQYGSSLVGAYDSTKFQGVYAMGDAYKLAINGTTTGNLYGITWAHPNAGGVASNLNTHGALVLENGGFLAAISGSIRCRDDMRTPIYYDSNDTAFYLDPNSTGTSLNVAGSIVAAGNVTAYSDVRLKENIQTISGALSKVRQLKGVTYTRNDLEDTTRRYGGLIAQDVQKVLPEAVTDTGDKLAVDYNATIGLLVEAIKELKAEIETLKAKG